MSENIYKIDLKDKKILYELNSDCRMPCSKIAKNVGLSTEVVNYRIKKFEEENIITQYQIIVNLAKLGKIQFKICLSLQHINSQELEKIVEELKKKEEIKWIVSTTSDWDLLISSETKSLHEVDSLKNEILSIFEGHVNKKAMSILIEASTNNRAYLLGEKNKADKTIMDSSEKITLEELDINILKILSENARKSVVEIASKLKTTPRIVNYRVHQLIKTKIILGFKIALNYEKLGIKFFKAFIYLDCPREERVKQMVNFFQSHPNIVHHVKVLGNWDLEPEFEVFSEAEFNKIIMELRDRFSDIIKNIEIITIQKEHKFVYF